MTREEIEALSAEVVPNMVKLHFGLKKSPSFLENQSRSVLIKVMQEIGRFLERPKSAYREISEKSWRKAIAVITEDIMVRLDFYRRDKACQYRYYRYGKGRRLTNLDALENAEANSDWNDTNKLLGLISDNGKEAEAIRSFEERTERFKAKEREAEEKEKSKQESVKRARRHLKEEGKTHLTPTLDQVVKNKSKRKRSIEWLARASARKDTRQPRDNTGATSRSC